jgi:FlaA1/EpsC-like NDP-sugar epimerase
MTDLAQGKVSISDLRELDIDDLLGREPVMPNHILLAMNVRSKVVMVTGAGGSIGSELCRQILAVGPSKLLLIEQSEFALYGIHQELEEKVSGRDIVLVPLLASVQDHERIREIMSTWHPDTVYHAAAYKHVPLVEHNPAEGIKNNVLGTLRTAQTAAENGVSDSQQLLQEPNSVWSALAMCWVPQVRWCPSSASKSVTGARSHSPTPKSPATS